MNIESAPPKVFISYSHDSQTHKEKVLELADRLRKDGVDATIDRYEESPPEGWQRWMLDRVEESDFVLVACTEQYDRRFRSKEEVGKGKGVTWEGGVIIQELYDAQGKNSKFIPITLNSESGDFIPNPLRSATNYRLENDAGYELLYRRLTNQPQTTKPDLGKLITLPHRASKQNFSDNSFNTKIGDFDNLILHRFPTTSNFDMIEIIQQCRREIIDKKGLIGLSICCSDNNFLKNFCERLRQKSRGNIQIRQTISIKPQVSSVKRAVESIGKYKQVLNNSDIVCPIRIDVDNPNSNIIKDFWLEVQDIIGSGFDRRLIIIMIGSQDCIFPSDVFSLPPPQFNKVHVTDWIGDLTLALHGMETMKGWEEIADIWIDKMHEHCQRDDDPHMEVSLVYEHLDFILSELNCLKEKPAISPQDFLQRIYL